MSSNKLLSVIASLTFMIGSAHADSIVTSIANVFETWSKDEIYVLSGADGNTYTMEKSESRLKMLKSFNKNPVKINFKKSGEKRIISSVEIIHDREFLNRDLNFFQTQSTRKFVPTDIDRFQKVEEIFDNLNQSDERVSQCFKRAHIWNYDMWADYGINTQKVFIFYTERFRALEDAKWRFHVAPMILSGGVEYMLDRTFLDHPVTVKQWASKFIKSENINCPVITDFKYLEENEMSRLCYIMKVPMYYLSPYDLGNNDSRTMLKKDHWVIDELQDARRSFKEEKNYMGFDTGKTTKTY